MYVDNDYALEEGRFVLIKGNLQGALVSIINVYAPPRSHWKFFKHFFEMIAIAG